MLAGAGIPAAAPATTYRDEVLADSPRAYWRLGEASGTTASDELGANPGTYSNVLLNQPGALASEVNASASFDGTRSYTSVPASSSLNLTTAVTVEFWAKRRAISNTYQVLVGKPGNGQSQFENYAVWLGTGNKYTAYFGNGTTSVAVQTPPVTNTNWHHLVATNDGSTARMYLDGVLKQSAPTTLQLTANGNPLNLGRASNNAYFYNGWLDEVAIYPSALSVARIQAHYTKGTTDLVPPAVSLTTPANGSALTSSNVSFAGTAGSAAGDASTLTVQVYTGTSPTGTPAQTLSATRQPDNSYSVSTTLQDGTWTAQAEQSDSAGNVGKSSANTFSVETIAPVVTISSGPPNPSSETSAAFNFSADKPASFQCKLDGGSLAACSSPKTYSGLADGSHTFLVEATDQGGNRGNASYTWEVDTVPPPSPTITSSPPSQTTSTSASFDFTDAEAGVTFLCQLDGGGFSICTSPKTFSGLGPGVHTFELKARDAASNESAPASYTWTITGTALPPPTLDATPPSPTNSRTATFSFSHTQPGVTFECSLDGGAFVSCTSPKTYSGLTDGSHTFAVRARDGDGTLSPAESYTWTVDTVAPTETITAKPPDPSNSTSPSFSFTADQPVTFECSLDGAAFASCASPKTYSGVADGSHTFLLRATDEAGNTNTVSYTWRIDTIAPTTTTGTRPPNPSNSSSPTFSFTADEPATFACSLDGASFLVCSSPLAYSGLADGAHNFRVRATDLAGNIGQPASYGWTIDTVPPPTPTITSTPPSPTNSTSASFSFSDSEAGVTLSCRLDGGGFSTCTSPKTYSGLADGTHSFEVRARDAAANDSSIASSTWTVDTTPPITTLVSTPSDPTNQTTATFGFFTSEPASTQCKLDNGAFTTCTSPQGYTGLANGSHTFQIKATDAAGNVGPVVSATWRVDTVAPTITLVSPANGSARGVWPTFAGTAGVAAGDSSTVAVRLYSGSTPSGTPLQTLTASVGAGGDYSATAAAPLGAGTYTVQAEQGDSAGNTALTSANTFTVGDPVVLAAGSIAACGTNGAARVANRVLSQAPDALVMPLGNNAYPNGQPADYQNCYDPTWGVAKARTRPVVGKHDEDVVAGGPPAGTGYLTYFASQLAPFAPTATDASKLYYSYDLGAWHVVVLNDQCMTGVTPNCDEQAQEQWLTNDLTAHTNQCTLAAFHTARWSSGSVHPNTPELEAFWTILYQGGVDLVLNGSAKDYERFARQDAQGNVDTAYGIRQIMVGTGGKDGLEALGTLQPNSEIFNNSAYGVAKLTLHASSYDWSFVPVADGLNPGGSSFTDSGTTNCHAAPPAPAPTPYRDLIMSDSPRAYWRLGEASGTTAADELGANPGTYSNVLLNQPGALASEVNASASFDGTRSYTSVPASSSLNLTTAVTVEFWAKRRTISSTYQVLVGKPGTGLSKFENYAVWLTTANKYIAYFGNGTTSVAVQTPAVTDTNWHHVVATNDGATVRIYLDGVLKQSTTTTLQLTANGNPLNLGRASDNTYFFNGWLDEVAIYPTALSVARIQAHYNRAIAN